MATQSIAKHRKAKQAKPSQRAPAPSSERGGRKEGRSPFVVHIEKLSIPQSREHAWPGRQHIYISGGISLPPWHPASQPPAIIECHLYRTWDADAKAKAQVKAEIQGQIPAESKSSHHNLSSLLLCSPLLSPRRPGAGGAGGGGGGGGPTPRPTHNKPQLQLTSSPPSTTARSLPAYSTRRDTAPFPHSAGYVSAVPSANPLPSARGLQAAEYCWTWWYAVVVVGAWRDGRLVRWRLERR